MGGNRLHATSWLAASAPGLVLAALVGVAGAWGLLGAAAPAVYAQTGSGEPAIVDVPPDHWAYQAVVTLVQRGYITLQAGRFDGSRPVDRYTLAAVVARLLKDVEAGQVRLTGDDLRLVRQLTNEFREELARWQDQRSQLSQRLDAEARNVARIDAKLTDVLGAFSRYAADSDRRMQQTEQATQALNQQLGVLSQRLAQVESAARGLGTVVQGIQGRIDEMQAKLDGLAQTATSLQEQVGALKSELVQRLQAEGEATSRSLQASAAQLQQLQASLQSLQQALRAQQESLQAQQQALAGQGQRADELSSRLGELDRQVQAVTASLNALMSSLSKSGIAPEQAGELIRAQEQSLQRLQASAEELQRLSQDVNGLRARLEEQARQVDELSRTLGQQQAALQEALTQQLAAWQKEREELRAEVASLRASLDHERARTDEIVRSLVREGGPPAAPAEELKAQVEQLRSQNRWLMAAALAGVVLALASLVSP